VPAPSGNWGGDGPRINNVAPQGSWSEPSKLNNLTPEGSWAEPSKLKPAPPFAVPERKITQAREGDWTRRPVPPAPDLLPPLLQSQIPQKVTKRESIQRAPENLVIKPRSGG